MTAYRATMFLQTNGHERRATVDDYTATAAPNTPTREREDAKANL